MLPILLGLLLQPLFSFSMNSENRYMGFNATHWF